MGFWKGAWTAASAVATLGGSVKLKRVREEYTKLHDRYVQLQDEIRAKSSQFAGAAQSTQSQLDIAKRTFDEAVAILAWADSKRIKAKYRKAFSGDSADLTRAGGFGKLSAGLSPSKRFLNEHQVTVFGAASGTATATGAWALAHVVGHASTGAAIASIHGAAAANASWALFGGGSLAAGGGGMALGHLVLPGIGTLVTIAVSSVLSYRTADKLEQACGPLRAANQENSQALATISSHYTILREFDNKLFAEHGLLKTSLERAKSELLPWGRLSRLWLWFRSWFKSSYFTDDELEAVERLRAAIERFRAALHVD